MKNRTKKAAGIVLLLASLTVCSAAWADITWGVTTKTRDIVLQEAFDVESPAAEGAPAPEDIVAMGATNVQEMAKRDFSMSLTSANKHDLYNIGEELVLTFKAEKDSYLTVLDFTPGGQIVLLFPNKWVEDNHVRAGQEIKIPAEGQKFVMKAGGPAGVDIIKAIASDQDVEILKTDDNENLQLAGPFAVLREPGPLLRDIYLMDKPEEPGLTAEPMKWSSAAVAVMTQAGEAGQPSGFVVAGEPGDSVKMWANKTKYLTGNSVLVKFLSDRAATLVSLVNIGASTAENNLLPEGAKIDLRAGEILALPRGEDKWKLVASGTPGKDVVKGRLLFQDGTEKELSFEVLVEQDQDAE